MCTFFSTHILTLGYRETELEPNFGKGKKHNILIL